MLFLIKLPFLIILTLWHGLELLVSLFLTGHEVRH